MAHPQDHVCSALCQTRPPVQEVSSTLEKLAFLLDFHMPRQEFPASTRTPAVPAQYHYKEKGGTEVIYLEGRDSGEDGERLPDHASRFWIYPGSSPETVNTVKWVLASQWQLIWEASSPDAHQAVA